MSHPSIHQLSTSEDEFLDPSTSPEPFIISGYELHPSIIAMDRGRTFSGLGIEDPHHHLQEFKELCSYLVNPRHVTRNFDVEVVPLFSCGKGGTMVHSQREECEW